MDSLNAKPELLAPGGSLEKCRIAYLYGADAVYAGGKDYNLRSFSRNLNREELAMASHIARTLGKKLYITLNTFAREKDTRELPAYLEYLQEIGIHGIIVSDPGIIVLASRWAPDVPLHLSTQANTTNALSVLFWKDQGVSRINLAREITFDELLEIRRATDAELEVFVHGAMCMSYSGRCLLSAFLNGRSANRGSCTQPCRWSYRLLEEKRPGEYFPIEEDARGAYILNSKDLCLIGEVGKLIASGVNALKIEGRMKSALYLAGVVRTYRRAIDKYRGDPAVFQAEEAWREDLDSVSHRPYTRGFLFENGGSSIQESVSSRPCQSHTLAGIVRPSPDDYWDESLHPVATAKDWTCIEVRSRLVAGTVLEFLYPDGATARYVMDHMEDLRGNSLVVAHPNAWIRLPAPFSTFPLQVIRTAASS